MIESNIDHLSADELLSAIREETRKIAEATRLVELLVAHAYRRQGDPVGWKIAEAAGVSIRRVHDLANKVLGPTTNPPQHTHPAHATRKGSNSSRESIDTVNASH